MPDLTKSKRLDELKSRLVAGARFTVGKLEREFGVTRRTVNRDLLELQEMGLDLLSETLSDGQRQWYADVQSRKITVRYSIQDVMSLFLGRRMFDFLENTSLEDAIGRVYSRIEAQLVREKDIVNARKLRQKVYLIHEGPKKLPEKSSEVLDEVLSGLLHEQRVGLRYVNHKGKKSRFVISPYTLVAYKRGLYVLGAVEEWGGTLLTYGLERITEAEWRRGDGFDYPEDFDPEAFFEKALFIAPGDPEPVELVFTKTTRPFITPRVFHRTQSLSTLSDGSLRMTLTVPIDFETVNWILSFGANVAVVRPPELRDKVKAELARALYQYRQQGARPPR